MLSAIEKESGEICCSLDELFEWKAKIWICIECSKELIPVDNLRGFRVRHFRHYSKNECYGEPESKEHLQMKAFAYQKLPLENIGYKVEKPDSLKVGRYRPDVVMCLKNGEKIAIECQASMMSVSEFEERNEEYTREGYFVLWLFHKGLLFDNEYDFIHAKVISVSALLRAAHKLYYGRIYVMDSDYIYSFHFSSHYRYDNGWGGGIRYYKTIKEISRQILNNKGILCVENGKTRIARFYDRVWWQKK